MKHVTVDEMIGFVSLDTLDEKSLELASKVTTHICRCTQCRGTVQAFQVICDEMTAMGERTQFPAAARRAAELAAQRAMQADAAPTKTLSRCDNN